MTRIDTKELLRLHEAGVRRAEIARRLGVSPSAVTRALSRAGVSPTRARRIDHDRVREMHAAGARDATIAAALGVSLSAVCKARQRSGLPVYRQPAVDHEAVCSLHARGLSDRSIASALGVSESVVLRVRRRLDLPAHERGRRVDGLWVRAWLDAGLSVIDIATRLGVTRQAVVAVIERRGWERRTPTAAYIAGACDAKGLRPPLTRIRISGPAATALAALLNITAPPSGTLDLTDDVHIRYMTVLMTTHSHDDRWRACQR